MGVQYFYCGECKEAASEYDFPKCSGPNCAELFDHPLNHGFYCDKCICDCKDVKYTRRNRVFCSKDCYKEYKEEKAKEKAEKIKAKEIIQVKKNSKFDIPK